MRCSDVTAWGTTHPKGDVSRQNPTGDGGKPPGHHGVELRFCHQCKEGADHDGSLRLQETDRQSLDKICFFIYYYFRLYKKSKQNKSVTCPMKMFPAAHRDSGADVPRLTLITQAILLMTTCMAPT